jgi:hypothetical protein
VLAASTVVVCVGCLALAGGLAGLSFGRVWTVPVALCGDGVGRQGATPLWYASLSGLVLALLVTIVALPLLVVSIVRRDRRSIRRSVLGLVLGIVAIGAGYGGAVVVLGDAPLFCF